MSATRRNPGILVPAILLLACATAAGAPDAFALNRQIGRGINIGNALEAPSEGEWGVTIKEEYFDTIRRAGFNSIRLPVCWSAHALREKPFTVDPEFFKRMDQVLAQAAARGFLVLLTMHHYNELYRDPVGQEERFLAIWRQVAERYRDRPASLLFEPLNEPHDHLDAPAWNRLLVRVHSVIRSSNPDRTLVFGPANYNDLRQLDALELPEGDRNLIATVHYYLPYEFTHQGAHWAPGSDAWLGRKWTGSKPERQAIAGDFAVAAGWAKRHSRPLLLGEFGANSKAEMASRVRWTKCVADSAVERGFSFTCWDFCAEFFGLYDRQARAWRRELLAAVIPVIPEKDAGSGGKAR